MVILESPGSFVIKIGDKYIKVWENKDENINKDALRLIGSIKQRIKKIDKSRYERYENLKISNRNISNITSMYGYAIDIRNAYFYTAMMLNIVSKEQYNWAKSIRKKTGIKPAKLLGMALGGYKRITLYRGEIIEKREYLEKSSGLFKVVANATHIMMHKVCSDLKLDGFYVDSFISRKKPNVEKIREAIFYNIELINNEIDIPMPELKVKRVKIRYIREHLIVNGKDWGRIKLQTQTQTI